MQELSKQIESHYLRSRPEDQHQLDKDKLCRYIQKCAHLLQQFETDPYEKNRVLFGIPLSVISSSQWNVFVFGSESDGTSLPSSDIDVGVHVNFRNTRRDKENLLCRLSLIISENDAQEKLLVKLILTARYPIIKVYDIYSRCSVNVSISDRYCYLRHQHIKRYLNYYNRIYSEMCNSDECLKKFIVFVKHWSKTRDVNNAYYGYLNSFGFTLFVMKFIEWFEICKLHDGTKWGLGDLVKEFYTFYVSQFDETIHSISLGQHCNEYTHCKDEQRVSKGCKYHIFGAKVNWECVLEVIDPVDSTRNITNNVGFHEFEHIKYEFIRALQIMENNKSELFQKLCKSTADSEAKYDINGHVHYGTFMYSRQHDTDTRYKYDPNVRWTLAKLS